MRNVTSPTEFILLIGGENMKKLAFVIAGLTTIALVAPASAEKIVIKHRDHGRHMGMMMHRDHGWDHHHGGKKIIIKHSHDHD
jgi:ABC-type sulfate transport system substrate-binding protein